MAGKQSGILPVAYYSLHTAEYAAAFLASDWLYFLWHEINSYMYSMYMCVFFTDACMHVNIYTLNVESEVNNYFSIVYKRRDRTNVKNNST